MTNYQARVLVLPADSDVRREMEIIGADPAGIEIMVPKCFRRTVKLYGVSAAAAHILKETFLSHGGDAAVHRNLIRHDVGESDVLLIGSKAQFLAVLVSLRRQPVKGLADQIERALELFEDEFAVPEAGSERIRGLFEAMRRRTAVMGIVNVTPDSFSDGGEFADAETAIAHALRMVEDGADVIDVGGESTRPGAEPVLLEQELERVIPVIAGIRNTTDALISIDTYKTEVARSAIEAGADIVNDISGLTGDPDMAALIAEKQVPAIIMHIKGTPRDMQLEPRYDDLMGEICAFLGHQIHAATEAGIAREVLIVDPGFGFGKTLEHNLEMVRRLSELKCLGRPILLGPSRKSTIGKVLGGLPPHERIEGTGAMTALAIMNGANMIRVHDVKAMVRVAKVADAVGKS